MSLTKDEFVECCRRIPRGINPGSEMCNSCAFLESILPQLQEISDQELGKLANEIKHHPITIALLIGIQVGLKEAEKIRLAVEELVK